MKQIIVLFALAFLLNSAKGFCQNVSETNFSLGINKLQSTTFKTYYDEECSPPTFLNLGVSHSWYRTDKKVTFNKEIGLNVQYSSPDLSSGGLGAHNNSRWKLFNLFAEATVQAQFRVDSTLSIGLGPAVEYLITGYNKEKTSYYTMASNPPKSGEVSHSGFNRDYFNDPLFGVRFSILNSVIGGKATLKINLSYFWMKQNESNFHSSKYIKVGLAIGLRSKKHMIDNEEN